VRFAHGWLEARVIRNASAVVFTTDAAREEFCEHYGTQVATRFCTIRNGCDVSAFGGSVARDPDAPFSLLHSGSLYGGRDPRPLIRAIARAVNVGEINRDRFRLIFLGAVELDGIHLEEEINEAGLDGVVSLLPRRPHAESVRMMREAAALLLLQPGTKLSIPGKLYEYLAVGRPILALAHDSETADMITAANAGIVVQPEDEQAIQQAVTSLYRGDVQLGAADRALFDGDERARELERLLRSFVRVPARDVAAVATGSGHEV
jgi:glycosyltransferase involved in cell wall biosynthesis